MTMLGKQTPELNPFESALFKSVVESISARQQEPKHKASVMKMTSIDLSEDPEDSGDKEPPSLRKTILRMMDGPKRSVERLAFEVDPKIKNIHAGLYRQKLRLLPDSVLKRIAIQDDLVASITHTRANQVAAFGRPRPDRFSIGYVIEPDDEGLFDRIEDDAQKKAIKERISKAERMLLTCGHTDGISDAEKMSFSQYLFSSTKNAVTCGRIATEIVLADDIQTGQKKFHRFRPVDVGTIYKAVPYQSQAESLREQARVLLESLKNEKIQPTRWTNDDYAWIQVVEGQPQQAFTAKELVCHNFYPSNDIELDGYPVTPLDTVISAVTTHINITTWNKVFFQSGRASRGMLVIKSDDADEGTIAALRQQFNASINGVNAAWRMPVFGIGTNDELNFVQLDASGGGRDMEFQYLSDTNARVILSAFQMSPEELPGYSHLARGTNSQALSESNQEYLLIAHRDVGIRPLLKQWEDFINENILPLIDPVLAEYCHVKLVGLEAETAEKESIRIQQDQGVHMTYDEILHKVQKEPIGKKWGGDYPLNPAMQAILDKFIPVGEQLAEFFDRPEARNDPQYAYVRDPNWFQWKQLQAQMQQAQAQQAQAAQQPQGQPGTDPSAANQQSAQQDQQQATQSTHDEIDRHVDAGQQALSKAEMTPEQRKLLGRQRALVDSFAKAWKDASFEAIGQIGQAILPELPDDESEE